MSVALDIAQNNLTKKQRELLLTKSNKPRKSTQKALLYFGLYGNVSLKIGNKPKTFRAYTSNNGVSAKIMKKIFKEFKIKYFCNGDFFGFSDRTENLIHYKLRRIYNIMKADGSCLKGA